jgi:hypothetical protein
MPYCTLFALFFNCGANNCNNKNVFTRGCKGLFLLPVFRTASRHHNTCTYSSSYYVHLGENYNCYTYRTVLVCQCVCVCVSVCARARFPPRVLCSVTADIVRICCNETRSNAHAIQLHCITTVSFIFFLSFLPSCFLLSSFLFRPFNCPLCVFLSFLVPLTFWHRSFTFKF